MPRALKILGLIVAVLFALTIVLYGVWSWYARQAFPKTSGAIDLPGLEQPVEILRDEYGVPHIYANTDKDLLFAQGYVHAQERFWQMEVQRRTASGRLSEIFGEETVGIDRFIRHFGFNDLGQRSYELLGRDDRELVDAYVAGVNAYLADRSPAKLGLEFALLGLQGIDVEIEPWTAADSYSWGYMLIYLQANQWNVELNRLDQLAAVGEEMWADLLPEYRQDRPVIISGDELSAATASDVSPLVDLGDTASQWLLELSEFNSPGADDGGHLAYLNVGPVGGSNSFAISGALTESGEPLLAGDPHLPINSPNYFLENGLHCNQKNDRCTHQLRGFSLVGVPFVLIGHNDRIAWTLTNAFFDPEDVYVERINPDNPNQYEVDGQWVAMTLRHEQIDVRGREEPEMLLVRTTRNGLVITDNLVDRRLSQGGDSLFALAYRWTALEPVRSLEAVAAVNRAQGWDEFVEALSRFDAGQQNWLYADVEGNIGYIMPGLVPIRAAGDGTLPMPGWDDSYQWTGFIPYDELPRVFNPEKGYIVTANNPQVRADDFPYLIGRYHDRGQRAARITELIESDRDGITLADMQRLQTDNVSLSAQEIIPYLESLNFEDPDMAAARDRLLAWDTNMDRESPNAALYNIFFRHLVEETFHDQLPESAHLSAATHTEDSLYFILQEENNPWWDDVETPGVAERRDAILHRAFELAYEEGVDLLGQNLDAWRWGDIHTITFQSSTLGSTAYSFINNLFNRGPFPVHGGESVPQKTCWSLENPYEATCLPALRMVLDLGNLSASQMIHSLGQSGHPLHRHYDDFIEPWRNFEYHASNWERADIEAGDYDLLTLNPG